MLTAHYAYVWFRKDSSAYYVGKGRGPRAFTGFRTHNISPPKDPLNIKIFPCVSEQGAFDLEKSLIAIYGRQDLGIGRLRNFTDGGDGASNPSEETRRKMSASRTGSKRSMETRLKMSLAAKGQRHWLGRSHSEETKQKCRETKLGAKNPNFGKSATPEKRLKASASLRGRKISEETIRRMSVARTLYWKRRKSA